MLLKIVPHDEAQNRFELYFFEQHMTIKSRLISYNGLAKEKKKTRVVLSKKNY